ncbi:ACT domain-containing protein [Sinanaerobacter chloroacetimidivorans]|uniref:ACT domain-containing protein n=1 Tax=Sinanaerobacter chloroacetimidivorans TaxID=2818044 RepID=A0A8J7W019_9FIRM|nr:ACT domain-containing protein [Sinanaerobacter chloroacetimidivorans]MBR0598302.1 ACT domain-containing protein [Sinanaerobacter chloroacetimidivorans]
MKIKVLGGDFSVCKIKKIEDVNFRDEFVFLSKTDEELSLVCKTQGVPAESLAAEHGWSGLRIEGELDFSLIGILSKIATVLADHKISIFAVSTYNTDYLFLKKVQLAEAVEALTESGYEIIS